ASDDRDACAFSRGIGQHLPRLVGAAELEDADRHEQNEGNRDGGLDQRRASLVWQSLHHDRSACLQLWLRPHPISAARTLPIAIAGPYAKRLQTVAAWIY